jgi:hypothetical protein
MINLRSAKRRENRGDGVAASCQDPSVGGPSLPTITSTGKTPPKNATTMGEAADARPAAAVVSRLAPGRLFQEPSQERRRRAESVLQYPGCELPQTGVHPVSVQTLKRRLSPKKHDATQAAAKRDSH